MDKPYQDSQLSIFVKVTKHPLKLIEGYKVEAVDTTGSGDCFIGALASQYLESKDLLDSVNFANKAAALSVMKKGASASMPSMEEVVNFHQIT